MSQQVGEPIVNVETVVTVLPDGRKVTKTIKKITHSYQVKVPAGSPIPEGARLVSTDASSDSDSNGSSNGHSAQPSRQSYQVQDHQQLSELNNAMKNQHGNAGAEAEPTVVVESIVTDDGRKVKKTTTTTSSSSSSGSPSSFSKFFKRLSHLGKSSSDSKPLPATPKESKTDGRKQKPLPVPKPEPVQQKYEPQPADESADELGPEIRKVQLQTLALKTSIGANVTLSDCTGERRALLIGINYKGLANPLHGCVNDTKVMKTFLLDRGFQEENIRVLTDDQVGTRWMPTKKNIMDNLEWLIRHAKENDSYFLHYSGHGGQTIDYDGDETEGMDNCIFPVDHVEQGVIVDDELHTILVKALPPGVRLTVLFDCCHSGSALDLPYIYTTTGYIRGSSALANLGHELVEGNFDADALKELQEKWQALKLEEKEFARQVKLKAANADVIMFSGCKDDQTSADVSVTRGGNTSSNGAMTYAFTKCISENPQQSYQEMLNNIRELLKEKYKQKPQLSSSRPMNMQELFHM